MNKYKKKISKLFKHLKWKINLILRKKKKKNKID